MRARALRCPRALCGAVFAGCVLALVACSRSGLDIGDAASALAPSAALPMSEADYLTARAVAECAVAERCCRQVALNGAAADCVERWKQNLAQQVPLANSNAHFNSAMAAACVTRTKTRACVPPKETPAGASYVAECDAVYDPGRLQKGEVCRVAADCAGDSGCVADHMEGATLVRACAPRQISGEDQACGPSPGLALQCAAPLLCNYTSQVCMRRAGVGETCIKSPDRKDTCVKGLVCIVDQMQRCFVPTPVGQRCDSVLQCEGFACVNAKCREAIGELPYCAR